VCACLWAASAGAVIVGEFGLQSRSEVGVTKTSPLQYHGGPVLHSSVAYTIYWDPVGTYRGDWKEVINEYFKNVGTASGSLEDVFAVDGQYTDAGGHASNESVYRGSYTDENAYPTSENGGNCSQPAEFACLTDEQIRAELQRVIASGALPGATGTPVYYVLTPPGVTVCTKAVGGQCSNSTTTPPNGICGYHSAIDPGGAGQVVYAVQPWVAGEAGLHIESENPLVTSGATAADLACQENAEPLEEPNQLSGVNPFGNYAEGLADVIVNDLSIEQSDIVVDPLLNGWYQNGTAAEQSDMCQWVFGPPPETTPKQNAYTHAATQTNETIDGTHYFVQWEFDSVGLLTRHRFECWSGTSLSPRYTAPNPVNVGDVVGFDGTESNITLDAKGGLSSEEPFTSAVYKWNFGDGTIVSGANDASEFHAYRSPGTYTATLTITDSAENSASYSETITVNGASTPGAATAGGGAAGGSGSGSGSGSPGAAGGAITPNPIASQSVLSHSLSRATRSGLVVRYSVNEQATGHFEVLLAASIARRIGLHYPLAKGLPKGTPAQEVIAKALLVTSKGGHSTMKIALGKVTAKRLHRLGKVSLMLRLILRGAGGGSTTVLSKISLAH
jgi:PKD domain